MKKIVLSIALLSISLVFAQKKEIRDAVKAAESGNNSEALAKISAADQILNGKLYSLKPSEQEDYYYAKGLALLKSGKTTEGADALAKMSEMGTSKIYEGKDNDKNRVYFVGKAQADKDGKGIDLKETSYNLSHTEKVMQEVNPILQKVSTEAQNAYNAKKYSEAANKFLQVNDLLKAAGQGDQTYEYYAAISYALAKDNPKAIEVYKHLIETGYTGIKTTYSAKNKKTNETENFAKETYQIVKKSADYTDFKEETSKSVEDELYQTAASLMIDNQQNDEAIVTIEKGLKKFPEDARLQDLKIVAYSRSGNNEALEKSVQEAITKNPNDKVNWANLGVLKSKNAASFDEAEKAFKKSLEIDPNYKPALQGLAFNLYLNSESDQKIVDQINKARQDNKIDQANKLMAERKEKFVLALPYLEKLHQLDGKDYDVARTLASIYHSLGQLDKEEAMKNELKNMSKDQ